MQSFLWLTGLKLDKELWELSYIGNHSSLIDYFKPESVFLYMFLLLPHSPSCVQSHHKFVSRFWDIYFKTEDTEDIVFI